MPRPKPEPFTSEELKKITMMSGVGLTVEKIATLMDMSKKTLERRLKITPAGKGALEKGRIQADTAVGNCAFKMATSGKHPAMTIFWLKCRARWSELAAVKVGTETIGADGEKKAGPTLVIDLSGSNVPTS